MIIQKSLATTLENLHVENNELTTEMKVRENVIKEIS